MEVIVNWLRHSGLRPTEPDKHVYMLVIEARFPLKDLETTANGETDSMRLKRLAGLAAMSSIKVITQKVRQ